MKKAFFLTVASTLFAISAAGAQSFLNLSNKLDGNFSYKDTVTSSELLDTSLYQSSGLVLYYPSVSLLEGNPYGEFRKKFPQKGMFGFTIDAVLVPYPQQSFWEPGFQVEAFLLSNKDDMWKGIEVKTSRAFFKLNFINRIKPLAPATVDPFFEFGYGVNISSTSTQYEIVDKATFAEEFFLGEEDNIETVNVKDFADAQHNISIGVGAIIAQHITVQLKYSYSPEIEFIEAKNIFVVNDRIEYKPSRSTMELITFSVGWSFDKMVLF